jgi:predicted amidohydrolase/WD40 repeat protein
MDVESWAEKLIIQFSRDGRVPDFLVMPEYWHRPMQSHKERHLHHNIHTNETIKALGRVAAKYQTYIMAGTMVELDKDRNKIYNSNVMINRDGSILGSYRKRVPTSGETVSPGNKVGIFDTVHGRIATLICFDVENQAVLEEVLAYQPQIIFNPTFIGASGLGNDRSVFHARWRVALDSMSRKFERKCVEHGIHLIRCDVPMRSAMGTSQMIGPYRTVYAPCFEETQFVVYVDKRKQEKHERNMYRMCTDHMTNNDFSALTIDPSYVRSDDLDNIHNRYNVYTLQSKYETPVVATCFYDKMHVISASAKSIDLFSVLERKLLHSVAHEGIQLLAAAQKHGMVYSAGNNKLTIWKVVDKKLVLDKSIDIEGQITKIAVKEDTNSVIVGDNQGFVTVIENSEQKQRFEAAKGSITGLVVQGTNLVTASETEIKVWNLADYSVKHTLLSDTGVKVLKSAHEKGIVMSLHTNGCVSIWDIDNGTLVKKLDNLNASNIIAWNRSKLITTNNMQMSLIDANEQKCVHRLHDVTVSNVENDTIECIESDGANRLIIGTRSENFNVFVYEFTSNRVATNLVTTFK